MKATAKVLNFVGIKEFSTSSCKLKADILDLIFGILNNKTLEILDITGNQSGDALAIAMAKLFQHNCTIHIVLWDSNDISINGLKSILLGLQRNHSIKHLPLPLLDLAAILKKENAETDLVDKISKDIQLLVYEKGRFAGKLSVSGETEFNLSINQGSQNLPEVDIVAQGKHPEVPPIGKPASFLALSPKTPLTERRHSVRIPGSGGNSAKKRSSITQRGRDKSCTTLGRDCR